MVVSVTHARVSSEPEGPDPDQIQSTDWNDEHTVTGVTDELVKVSSNDTTADYLLDKLVAGTNITLTENSDGGNETITIDATGSGPSGPSGNLTSDYARFEDDCWFATTTDRHDGNLIQVASGTSAATSSGLALYGLTPNHPGIIQLSPGSASNGRCALRGGEFYIGAGEVSFETIIALYDPSDASEAYTVRAGLTTSDTGNGSNGIYFRYTHSENSGKWQAVTRASNNETPSDTGVTPTFTTQSPFTMQAAFVRLGFVVNAAATSVEFFINGSSVATNSTHIPSTSTAFSLTAVSVVASAGSSTTDRNLFLDYYSLTTDFTTPR